MKAIELSKIMPFPKELVGIWTSKRNAFNIELVIRQDSSGTVLRYTDKGEKYSDSFQIQQVELVENQLYRYVGGANLGVIGYDGLGGMGKDGVPLKYDLGFALHDGRFQPVAWQVATDEEFDYAAPIYFEVYDKVLEAPSTKSLANKEQN